MAKKIVLAIAFEGYQPVEYATPKQMLEKAGHVVTTASDAIGKATSKYDDKVEVDIRLSDAVPEKYDALYIIGGPGALKHLDNETTHQVLKLWKESGKPYGAICISSRILAHAGVLDRVKATGWNGDGEAPDILQTHGATFVHQGAVRDGNVVTADGPESAEEFGKYILECLK